jgi:hypothetical protein
MNMNCDQIRTLLESLPLAEFTTQQLNAAEEHASDCLECNKLLSAEKELASILKGLPDPEAPAGLTAAVMARIEQHNEKSTIAAKEPPPIQSSEWPISIVIAGIAMTLCIYTYELLNGRSTTFNLFSLWTDGWGQWLFAPVQLNFVGLAIATGFVFYLVGFLLMLRDRDFST